MWLSKGRAQTEGHEANGSKPLGKVLSGYNLKMVISNGELGFGNNTFKIPLPTPTNTHTLQLGPAPPPPRRPASSPGTSSHPEPRDVMQPQAPHPALLPSCPCSPMSPSVSADDPERCETTLLPCQLLLRRASRCV